MKKALINFTQKHISEKSFFVEWVTTGRAMASNECLDSNSAYIEDTASSEKIISFLNRKFDILKKEYFENNDGISLSGFANFVVYEYGYSVTKELPHIDGGNVTYLLYVK